MKVCLVYPNKREIGLSNLGFHKIYRSLTTAGAKSDIAFLPDGDGKLLSENTKQPLNSFDLIAFSVTFEMDELNLLKILKRSSIPLLAKERGDRMPIVAAGGVAVTLNPEVLSRFIDFFVLGEGELAIDEIVSTLSKNKSKDESLEQLALVDGVYVPSLYKTEYGEKGELLSRTAIRGAREKVKRLINLDYHKSGMAQVEGMEGSAFGGSYLVEAGKGCGQGCRFCATGFIYRPVRHVDARLLKKQTDKAIEDGRRIGLVGSAICEHPDIDSVLQHIVGKGGSVTVSSLRIGLVNSGTFERLAKGGCKTVTIAPEAGSAKLRRSINKWMEDDEILQTVSNAVSAGILNVKTYFLVGLPGEREEDVQAIVELVKKMREVFIEGSKPFGRVGTITVGANPFIPKPSTPFQWEPMAPMPELKKKLAHLKKEFGKMSNVECKPESVRLSAAQALLSVGSADVGSMLLEAFNGKSWNEIIKREPAKNFFARKKGKEEILPWDFIDSSVERDFLWREYERSMEGKTSPACPPQGSGCRKCGVFTGVCV